MKVINALLSGLLTITATWGSSHSDIIGKDNNEYKLSPFITLRTELDSFRLEFITNKYGM